MTAGQNFNVISSRWVVGISWLTGNSGYLPTNYVERTAETNAWTLHTVFPFNKDGLSSLESPENKTVQPAVCDNIATTATAISASINKVGSNSSLERLVGAQECDSRSGPSVPDLEVESLYAKVVRQSRESPPGVGELHHQLEFEPHGDDEVSSSTPTRPLGPRQLFITRHGERVDFTFGLWIPYSFDKEGR